ncbi:MAG: Ig-like domain-containing protein, partial [Tumebacillaceae bacterium]
MFMKHLVRILRVAIASAVIASVSTCGVGVFGHAELAQAATIRFTSAAPSAPIPNPVTDHDTVVAGKAKVGLTVVVKTANALLGSTPVNSDGTFSLAISPLNGGTLLYITALDQTTGRSSSAARVTVRDTTAPLPPVVARVGDSYTTVTGAAEPSSTVSVYAGTKSLGSAKAKSDGTFTVSIRKQASGAVLSVFATDASKNKSEATSVTVVDTTPPQLKSVNPATDTSTLITGLADKNVTINVRKGDTLLGTATSRADGTFTVTIAPQVGGSVLAVTAADELQNESIAKTVTVKDTTPPSVPIVQPVTDKDKTVTGTTEANATVKVKVGTRTLGSAKANAQGSFTVPISPTSGGSILSVTATDAAQNSSSAATRSVIDTTAPTAPRANAVKDTDLVVTGTAE